VGSLLALEGLYSAGKSTQRELLVAALRTAGQTVVETEWNSSEILADHMLRLRIAGRLSPRVLFLLELADFTDRYERCVQPALESGHVVVSDRYVETGIARGVVRGLDRQWCRQAYCFASTPSSTVYFDCPPEITLMRRRTTGRTMAGYVAGEDFLDMAGDTEAKFVHYQRLLEREYKTALRATDLMVDATKDRAAIHDEVLNHCRAALQKGELCETSTRVSTAPRGQTSTTNGETLPT
jgi:dTMP kinase